MCLQNSTCAASNMQRNLAATNATNFFVDFPLELLLSAKILW